MSQVVAEVLRHAKVTSMVPAAPWDPDTLAASDRATHDAPAAVVVVAELDVLVVPPALGGADVVVVVDALGDEQAARATAITAGPAPTRTRRKKRSALRS
jgi:hypothetical protein